MKRKIVTFLACALAVVPLVGCEANSNNYNKNGSLDTTTPVTLRLTSSTVSFKAIEDVIADFTKLYPNCTVVYEKLDDYYTTLASRLKNDNDNPSQAIDLFVTENILPTGRNTKALLPYAMDLNEHRDTLDLSNTFEGLISNFTVPGTTNLLAIPFGGELRGMYVNKSLLASKSIAVPKNYKEFLAACNAFNPDGRPHTTLSVDETTKKETYAIGDLPAGDIIPLQGNPGGFGQKLLYPYICNMVANASDYQTAFNKVNNCEAGVSELFREPLSRLYELVDKGYYNYAYTEDKDKGFLNGDDSLAATDFLNLKKNSSGDYVVQDGVGKCPFMPATASFQSYLDKVKDDYHSPIDYTFILSPLGDEGGYAYLSPSIGIAINKGTKKSDWSLEFLNFLFSKKENQKFAESYNIIANSTSAFDDIKAIQSKYGIPANHISHLGQTTFKWDGFYSVIVDTITSISKANKGKYLLDKSKDTMYSLDSFLSTLETNFAKYRTTTEAPSSSQSNV